MVNFPAYRGTQRSTHFIGHVADVLHSATTMGLFSLLWRSADNRATPGGWRQGDSEGRQVRTAAPMSTLCAGCSVAQSMAPRRVDHSIHLWRLKSHDSFNASILWSQCTTTLRSQCRSANAPLLLQPPRALKPRSLSIIIISRVVQPRPNFYLSVSLCSETKVSLMR